LLQPADTRLLFAGADYRRLWAIGGLTGIARWLEFVAIAIFAYELTHSPELVALLAVLRMVPYVLLGFLVGAVADAIDRKHLLVAGFAIMLLASSTMLIVTAAGAATYAAAAAIVMVSGAFWTPICRYGAASWLMRSASRACPPRSDLTTPRCMPRGPSDRCLVAPPTRGSE